MDDKLYPVLTLLVVIVGYAVIRFIHAVYTARQAEESYIAHYSLLGDNEHIEVMHGKKALANNRVLRCRSDCAFFDTENGNTCFCGSGT